jgi:threonine dehydratase
MSELLSLDMIMAARERLRPYVVQTPVVAMVPGGWRLKAENLQPIGAFKIRGAFNALLALDQPARSAGVIGHSSGNHAQAVAYAARALGIAATLVMPDNAAPVKIAATRRWGAEIILVPPAERASATAALAARHGFAVIHPYDAPEILAGTGTIGLELIEQCPDMEIVAVPISGGGLIGGVSAAIKAIRPDVRIIGVEPELAADAQESFRTGTLTGWPVADAARTIADGLRVAKLGDLGWRHLQAFVDDVVTVSEEAIMAAVGRIAREARLVAEPSGAVALAGLMTLGDTVPERSVAILSGGNVDDATFCAALASPIMEEITEP